MTALHKIISNNMIVKLRPLQRIVLSLILAAIAFTIIPKNINTLQIIMIVWIVFSTSYLIPSWIILFTRSVEEIRKQARKDDGSKVFVFIMIIISSLASMFTVLELLTTSESGDKIIFLCIAAPGMLLSWVMVHSIFTFHYAHIFYEDDRKEPGKMAEGLIFPEDDKPDYIDFAYFSFVIGCTFQVSDVEVTSKKIRRLVLLHGLLSFGLNTFVVALLINFIAGLSS